MRKIRYIILVEIYERKRIKEQGWKRATDDVYVSSTHKTCFTVGTQSDTERKVWMEKYANVEVTKIWMWLKSVINVLASVSRNIILYDENIINIAEVTLNDIWLHKQKVIT